MMHRAPVCAQHDTHQTILRHKGPVTTRAGHKRKAQPWALRAILPHPPHCFSASDHPAGFLPEISITLPVGKK